MELENIFFEEKDEDLAARAKAVIQERNQSGSLRNKAAEAMTTLVENSRFSKAYASWLLADDPGEFRKSLPHNVQFRQELEDRGIDKKIYFKGIEDKPITIDISAMGEELRHPYPELNAEILKLTARLVKIAERYDHVMSRALEYMAPERGKAEFEEVFAELEKKYTLWLDGELADWSVNSPTISYMGRLEGLTEVSEDLEQKISWAKSCFEHEQLPREVSVSRVEAISGYEEEIKCENKKRAKIEARLGTFEGPLQKLNDAASAVSHRAQVLYNDNRNNDAVHANPSMANLADHDSITYFVQREEVPPEDVLIGVDGGCCIGIYGDGIDENNTSLPYLMMDEGTAFFGIYRSYGNKKPHRVGFALMFAGSDQELRPILCVNSVELSQRKNPVNSTVLDPLIDHVHDYLSRFAHAAGFKGVSMGNKSYNTSTNYGSIKFTRPSAEDEIVKMPEVQYPKIYQEFFSADDAGFLTADVAASGLRNEPNWVWVQKDL